MPASSPRSARRSPWRRTPFCSSAPTRSVSEEIGAIALLGLPAAAGQDAFIPLGYRAGPKPGTMVPTYPPGLPLHLALLGTLGGWSFAPFLAGPIAAIASLLLLFGIGRELGLSRGFAAAGMAMLAASPIFFGMAIQPMSDVPATAWVLAAIYFGLRARRSEGEQQDERGEPRACGASITIEYRGEVR